MIAMSLLAAAEETVDETQSHSWIFPEGYELLFGSIASIIIFALLWWKAGPLIVKGMRSRTERIQAEIGLGPGSGGSAVSWAAVANGPARA